MITTKPNDHTIRPKKQPKVYLEHAGFCRGIIFNIQLTGWDLRRDAVHSKLRRIMRNEKLHTQFRKYFIKARIA